MVRASPLVRRLLLGLALSLGVAPAAVADEAPALSAARESRAAAIPVGEVATRAAEAAKLLQDLTTRLTPSPGMAAIRNGLPELQQEIDLELAATASILRGQPSLDVLQSQHQIWQRRQKRATEWLGALTQRASRSSRTHSTACPTSARGGA